MFLLLQSCLRSRPKSPGGRRGQTQSAPPRLRVRPRRAPWVTAGPVAGVGGYLLDVPAVGRRLGRDHAAGVQHQAGQPQQLHAVADEGRGDDVVHKEGALVRQEDAPADGRAVSLFPARKGRSVGWEQSPCRSCGRPLCVLGSESRRGARPLPCPWSCPALRLPCPARPLPCPTPAPFLPLVLPCVYPIPCPCLCPCPCPPTPAGACILMKRTHGVPDTRCVWRNQSRGGTTLALSQGHQRGLRR